MFEFELFSTINQTINLTYSLLNRKRSLLCISCYVFTVAFYKMLSILPQLRLLSDDYPANHPSIQIFLLFESIINSVVRLPRSRGIFESRVIFQIWNAIDWKDLGTRLTRDGRLEYWNGLFVWWSRTNGLNFLLQNSFFFPNLLLD